MSTLYFENFDTDYDNFEKEGFNLDDLLLKSKFAFLNGKYTFSSKSKFAFGTKNAASHEYSLKHKSSKGTFTLKNKGVGETSLETEAACYSQKDLSLKSYSKFVLTQSENARNLDGNVLLRLHHKNNALLSFGFENWSVLQGSPSNVTAYTSYGVNNNGANLVFNSYFNYSLLHKFVPKVSLLLRAEKGDIHGYLRANVNRSKVASKETEGESSINQSVDLLAKVFKKLNDKTNVGATATYNLEDKSSSTAVYLSHVLDRVRVNAKVNTDRNLSLGVTSAFDDVTINFAAGATLNSKVETVGEVEKRNHWANFNYGLTVEFNRV